jgi:hypothetical protein
MTAQDKEFGERRCPSADKQHVCLVTKNAIGPIGIRPDYLSERYNWDGLITLGAWFVLVESSESWYNVGKKSGPGFRMLAFGLKGPGLIVGFEHSALRGRVLVGFDLCQPYGAGIRWSKNC